MTQCGWRWWWRCHKASSYMLNIPFPVYEENQKKYAIVMPIVGYFIRFFISFISERIFFCLSKVVSLDRTFIVVLPNAKHYLQNAQRIKSCRITQRMSYNNKTMFNEPKINGVYGVVRLFLLPFQRFMGNALKCAHNLINVMYLLYVYTYTYTYIYAYISNLKLKFASVCWIFTWKCQPKWTKEGTNEYRLLSMYELYSFAKIY